MDKAMKVWSVSMQVACDRMSRTVVGFGLILGGVSGLQARSLDAEIMFVGKGAVTIWSVPQCRQRRLIRQSEQSCR